MLLEVCFLLQLPCLHHPQFVSISAFIGISSRISSCHLVLYLYAAFTLLLLLWSYSKFLIFRFVAFIFSQNNFQASLSTRSIYLRFDWLSRRHICLTDTCFSKYTHEHVWKTYIHTYNIIKYVSK